MNLNLWSSQSCNCQDQSHIYLVSTELNVNLKFKLLQQSILNSLFKYSKKQEFITRYLITLQCSTDLCRKAFIIFKKKTLKYLVQNAELFKCENKNRSIQWVDNDSINQKKIIKNLHDQAEHKEMKFIYQWIFTLYWWKNLYIQIKKHKQIYKNY